MGEYKLNEDVVNFILYIDGMDVNIRCEDVLSPVIKSTTDLNIGYIGNQVTISKKILNIAKEEKMKMSNNRFKFTNMFRKTEKKQPVLNEVTNEKGVFELIIPIYQFRDTCVPVKLENISIGMDLTSGNLTIHNVSIAKFEARLVDCNFDLKKVNIGGMDLDNSNVYFEIENSEVARLEITSQSGELNINNVKFAQFDIDAEEGDINLKECIVDDTITNLKTSIGNININNSKFDNLMLTTFDGDIQVEDTTLQEMTMHSNSSGLLTLKRVDLDQLYLESCEGVNIEDSKMVKASINISRGDLTLAEVISNGLNVNIDVGNVSVSALDFDKDKEDLKQVLICLAKGDIDLENLKSEDVRVLTNNGALDAEDITANQISFETNSGYLDFQRAVCESIKLNTINGLVDIRDIKAKELTIDVDSDSIYVQDTKVDFFDASTTEGRVFIEKLQTESTKISNNIGDLEANKVTADSFVVNFDWISNTMLLKNMKCKYLEAVTPLADLYSNNTSVDSIEFTTDMTDITIENITADSFDMSVDKADIYINDIDARTLNIDVSAGSVDVSVLESLFNCKTELSAIDGNIIKDTEEEELPSVVLDKKKNIDISTNQGNIKVLFKGKSK